jgi:hypothetical protein
VNRGGEPAKIAVGLLKLTAPRAPVQVWLDEELGGGAAWWTAIRKEIRKCTVFLFALSNNSLNSKPWGASRIFTGHGVSGSTATRPDDACLDHLREGDVLTVWKLDRLGRNTQHVLAVVDQLTARGIGFRSLTEGLHTVPTPVNRSANP